MTSGTTGSSSTIRWRASIATRSTCRCVGLFKPVLASLAYILCVKTPPSPVVAVAVAVTKLAVSR